MTRSLGTLLLLAIFVPAFVFGCDGVADDSDTPHAVSTDDRATVLLVSIDGLRWDYLDVYDAPTLSDLAEQGTHVERFVPVFPTKTFPTHYSLVTGLYPENHGIVSNNMYDPEMDEDFSLGDQEAITDSRWWNDGEPIWVTAEEQNVRAGTYFWPGSEAEIHDVRPSYWLEYDSSVPGEERVDQILEWVDKPDDERPNFMTLYFSKVDSEGHAYGPESDEVGQALSEVDSYIERLLDGFEARGIEDDVNIIITSDHGMSATSQDRVVLLDDYIDLDNAHVVDYSPVAMIRPEGEADAREMVEALDQDPNLTAYHRDEMPDTLHFQDHHRIPEVLALADDEWSISTRSFFEDNPSRVDGGAHGYDIRLDNMQTLLIGHGPAFRSETTVEEPIGFVHLYETMAHILDLEPAPNDGSLDAMRPVLEEEAVPAE